MDIKALEELEDKCKRGREIVNDIKRLKENISYIDSITIIEFWGRSAVELRVLCSTRSKLHEEMKLAYIQAAEEEIVLLEQELADL